MGGKIGAPSSPVYAFGGNLLSVIQGLASIFLVIISYLYQQRKTLAPEEGGDPPYGGEDFPHGYR